jgi:hypothetical protein
LFIGVLSALPLVGLGNCCCCLWIVSGGVLAAYLDQQNDPRPTSAGRGALVGVKAGVVGAFVWLIVTLLLQPILEPVQQRVVERLLTIARDLPPEVREALEQSDDASGFRYVIDFLGFLVIGVIFSTLGGLLGASFFKNDVPPAVGGGPGAAPPPLPE